MKKSLLFALAVGILSAHAQPVAKTALSTVPGNPTNEVIQDILSKQLSANKPARKTTAAMKRLSSSGYVANGTLSDSNHYYYSNSRGSVHTNADSYFDYYYPTGATKQNVFSDSSIHWFRNGPNFQKNKKAYTYDNNGKTIQASSEFTYGISFYDLTYDAQGRVESVLYSDSFGTGVITPKTKNYYLYDAQSRKLKDSVIEINSGQNTSKTDYVYDANGNLLERHSYNKPIGVWDEYYKVLSTYDASNRLLKTVTYYGPPLVENGLDTFGYDGTTSGQYTYRANSFWSGTLSSWQPNSLNTYELDAQNRVDWYYIYEWNGTEWDTIERDQYTYTPDNLLSHSNGYEYLGGGNFSTTPYDQQTFYFEDYYPAAVNDVKPAKATFTLYPNPATNHITINVKTANAGYSITNMSGQLVQSGTTTSGRAINISNLAKGSYTLSISENGQTSSMQVQKL